MKKKEIYFGKGFKRIYFNQEAQNKDIITYLEKLYK